MNVQVGQWRLELKTRFQFKSKNLVDDFAGRQGRMRLDGWRPAGGDLVVFEIRIKLFSVGGEHWSALLASSLTAVLTIEPRGCSADGVHVCVCVAFCDLC